MKESPSARDRDDAIAAVSICRFAYQEDGLRRALRGRAVSTAGKERRVFAACCQNGWTEDIKYEEDKKGEGRSYEAL